MAIDGVEPANIEGTLRLEVAAMQERHKAGKKFFDLIKIYGPGWGLVGTLVGQVGMFGKPLANADIGELGSPHSRWPSWQRSTAQSSRTQSAVPLATNSASEAAS